MRRFRIVHAETDWTVDASPDGAVVVGDRQFHVVPAGEGRYRVVGPDGRSTLVAVAGPAHALWAAAGGRAHALAIDTGPGRRSTARSAGDLSAPMPATVVRVVAVGDRVAAGDPVVVLEAMKMELTVRAPRDGVVTAVACAPGELVAPGRPLVELGA